MTPTIRLRDARPILPLLSMPTDLELDIDTLKVISKFGRNTGVTTTLMPVSIGKQYRTPTAAVTLQAVSDDADDKADGAGARQLTILGIVSGWVEGSTTVNLNGTTEVDIDTNFLRIFRVYVSSSGTYATSTAPSQQGNVVIKEKTGGALWMRLDKVTTFGVGQSQISAYTIPLGRVGYISEITMSVDSVKTASIYLFRRDNANTITAPYSAMRLVEQYDGVQGIQTIHPPAPIGPFIGPSDIGFMAKVASTTASVSVNFEILTFEAG